MKGLGQVTAGLATAFDTTLIALVMAIVLLFPTESLRGTEYAMLDQIEAFANESLLRRMSDDQRELSDEELPEVVRDALKSAFQEHQRWLAQWQAQVAQLGQIVGADFETIVGRVQEQVSAVEAGRVEKYESLGRVLEDIFDKAGQATLSWHQAEQDARSRTEEFLGALSQFQDTLGGITKLCGDISVEQNRMWEMYSEGNLNNSMLSLAEQVAKLAERLDGSEKVMDKTRLLGGSQPRAVADLPPDGTEPIQVIEPTVGKSSSQQQGVFGRLWGRRR